MQAIKVANYIRLEAQNYMSANNIFFEKYYTKSELLGMLKTLYEKVHICNMLGRENGHTVATACTMYFIKKYIFDFKFYC